ncbi:Golgi transport complex subunit 4, partial [Perkinsus olseni]
MLEPTPTDPPTCCCCCSVETADDLISRLQDRENEVDKDLSRLYKEASHKLIEQHHAAGYQVTRDDDVELQEEQIIGLEAEVSELSQTAGALSSRVEELDNTKHILQEAHDLAQSVITIHHTINTCNEALLNDNVDDAAKDIAKIREIKQKYPKICEVCDNATMKESKRLEDEVCSSVRKAFDSAIIGTDKDGVSRCARLFYPLGMTTEAVARYVRFIRQTLAEQCKQKLSSVIASNDNASTTRESSNDGDRGDGGGVVINDKYVNTLTNVFLAVADIIQDHQRNIEEEFGPMNFVMVLRGLQAEADTQAISVINRIRVSRKRIMKDFENTGDEVMEDATILTSIDLGQKDAVIDEMCIITQRCNQFEHYIHSVSRQVVAELSSEDHKKLIDDGDRQGEEGRNQRVKNKVDHNPTYTEDGLAVITDLTETVQ